MTKSEFSAQFKRLLAAGYRLPAFDGITIKDVIDEWFGTFGPCSVGEFSQTVDRLKQRKTDTFWPATGEIWQLILEVRKDRYIRKQSQDPGPVWGMSDADTREFLSELRACQKRIIAKQAMPHAEPQVKPDHSRDDEAGEP